MTSTPTPEPAPATAATGPTHLVGVFVDAENVFHDVHTVKVVTGAEVHHRRVPPADAAQNARRRLWRAVQWAVRNRPEPVKAVVRVYGKRADPSMVAVDGYPDAVVEAVGTRKNAADCRLLGTLFQAAASGTYGTWVVVSGDKEVIRGFQVAASLIRKADLALSPPRRSGFGLLVPPGAGHVITHLRPDGPLAGVVATSDAARIDRVSRFAQPSSADVGLSRAEQLRDERAARRAGALVVEVES